MQKLTVGRIVHWNYRGKWLAAIVTKVPDLTSPNNKAELYVFPTTELDLGSQRTGRIVTVDARDQDDGLGANIDSWRWPPRE